MSQSYGRSRNDIATAGVQTADGGYALSCYTRTSVRGNDDAGLIKPILVAPNNETPESAGTKSMPPRIPHPPPMEGYAMTCYPDS